MMDFITKNFKTIFIGLIILFAFAILVQGCNKPSRVWNWSRTKIWNRGDGNWFDWRNRNREKDDGMQPGEDEQALSKDESMGDTFTWVLVIGGGLVAVWFLVLTPEQRDKINPFKKDEGSTATPVKKVTPTNMRADLIEAYCLLFDNIADDAAKKSLNDVVLPKVMTANDPKKKTTRTK